MKISRKSPLTGKTNEMDLPVNQEQLARYMLRGELIQNVFPDLTPDQREFIKTGYTAEDWKAMFPENCSSCEYGIECNDGEREQLRCRHPESDYFDKFVSDEHRCPHWSG